MKFFRCFLRALLLCATWGGPASGGLAWSSPSLDLPVPPGATQLHGTFAFINESDTQVTVTSVKPACGCTTAALEKKVYAPGESGTIPVTFAVGDRVGPQVKKIVVRTDDPAAPVTTLTVKTTIPRWAELRPRLLMWQPGEALEAKTLEVTFHDPHPVVLTAVESEADGLFFDLKTLEKGRRYAVTVRPEATEDAEDPGEVRALVRLKTKDAPEAAADQAPAHEREAMLRFLVRIADNAAAASTAGPPHSNETP